MTVPDELRRSAAHVFVDDLTHPALDDTDVHHLVRVLRLAMGETVSVSDGIGSWRLCRHVGDGALEPTSDVRVEPPVAYEIAVAFAPVKGDRPEWVVQKLTELGVDRIVPFVSERSVVRWDDERALKQHERLVRVAREASMQSRRVKLPIVEPVTTFAEVVAREGACVADPAGAAFDATHRLVIVGPEGGFSPGELTDVPCIALPGGILRAETAAITAGVGLATNRG